MDGTISGTTICPLEVDILEFQKNERQIDGFITQMYVEPMNSAMQSTEFRAFDWTLLERFVNSTPLPMATVPSRINNARPWITIEGMSTTAHNNLFFVCVL